VAALLAGSILAVAALAFVLWPILAGIRGVPMTSRRAADAPEASALEALREIEFDRATGKLSLEDYDALRARYAPRAVEELRERDAEAARGAPSGGAVSPGAASSGAPSGAASSPATDRAEALIARVKSSRGLTCPQDGPRPESDALFCSDCGRYLGKSCLKCGAAIEDPNARFCAECGTTLAA
jgi:hypothetical protein